MTQNVNYHSNNQTNLQSNSINTPQLSSLLHHHSHIHRHQPNPNSPTTMAAFFHHRKLMPFTDFSSNLTQLCSSICNNNTAGICTIKECSAVCPLICCPPDQFFYPLPPLDSPPLSPDLALSTHPKLSSTLKISIALLVTTFSIFVLYTLYKFYTVWSRSRRSNHPGQDDERISHRDDFLDEDHGPVLDHPIWYIRTVGLEPGLISAITIVKYKKGEGLVEGTDCSICLSEFQEDETIRLLPKCSHAFHIPCIDTWLQSHTNCPLCRAGIVRNGVTSLSLREPVVEDLATMEETQVGNSVDNGELEMEMEDDRSELRVGSEEEDELFKLEMGKGEVLVRRSVSLDCLSAARLSAEIGQTFQSDRNLGTKSEKAEKLNSNAVLGRVESGCSIARSLQRGPEFIKRSFSCSGKVLFSRQSR